MADELTDARLDELEALLPDFENYRRLNRLIEAAPYLLQAARREKKLREALQTVRDDVRLVYKRTMSTVGLETTLQVIDEALKD